MSAKVPCAYSPEINQQTEYAGFCLRVAAYFIDGIIIATTSFILDKISIPFWVSMALSLVYAVGFNSSKYQGTIGKMIIGIKITDLAGKRISIRRALGRYCFQHIFAVYKLLCGVYWWTAAFANSATDASISINLFFASLLVYPVGVVMIAFTARKQALHDIVCGTLVIK